MATYVCSDIHGLKEHYDQMIQDVHEDDHLYVIGDVIDRGESGITILLDLLSRNNVEVMLGNHEYMMYRYYQAKFNELPKDYEEQQAIDNWLRNHCTPTMNEFDKLSPTQQHDLLDTIKKMPVVICDLIVNNQKYYLVHGCPSTLLEEGIYTMAQLDQKGFFIEALVWNRMDPSNQYFHDRCVISGHTPTVFFQNTHPYTVWFQGEDLHTSTLFDIDCGCAAQNEDSRIALMCLEDRSIRYY